MEEVNVEALGIDLKTDKLSKFIIVTMLVVSLVLEISISGSLRFTGGSRLIMAIIGLFPGILGLLILISEILKRHKRKRIIKDRYDAVETGKVYEGKVIKVISVVDKYRRARVIACVEYDNGKTIETLKMKEKSVFKWGDKTDRDDEDGEIYETSKSEDNALIGRNCTVYEGDRETVVDIFTGEHYVRI